MRGFRQLGKAFVIAIHPIYNTVYSNSGKSVWGVVHVENEAGELVPEGEGKPGWKSFNQIIWQQLWAPKDSAPAAPAAADAAP